jgi:ATP-dependent Clp protease ATP-binding subunit ClpB
VYGARPIRRWLENKVVTVLSGMLARKVIDENTTVYIDVGPNDSYLVYRVENNGGRVINAETCKVARLQIKGFS